jgi:hypothetical protein
VEGFTEGKNLYLQGKIMMVGNGEATDFWKDAWFGTIPLIDKFSQLFDISIQKHLTVDEAAVLGRWLGPNVQV